MTDLGTLGTGRTKVLPMELTIRLKWSDLAELILALLRPFSGHRQTE